MIVENTQGITSIEFERQVQAFCPLGNDYYTARIIVYLEPDKNIMDYCHTDSFIKSLGGTSLIIEDLVKKVFDHIDKYDPKYLRVSAEAESNVHFPVTVTIEKPEE